MMLKNNLIPVIIVGLLVLLLCLNFYKKEDDRNPLPLANSTATSLIASDESKIENLNFNLAITEVVPSNNFATNF